MQSFWASPAEQHSDLPTQDCLAPHERCSAPC